MFLIIEFILTIAVWRRGWKAWALLPVGIMMAVALTAGVVAGLAGMEIDSVTFPALILDGLAILVLCVMLKRAPGKAKTDSGKCELLPAEMVGEIN